METSKIVIFESISLQSKLMPYYGSPPEGFLLLSLLSKGVREYLLEHYPQYRRFMFEYAKMIKYEKGKHLEMKLPLDLFKFSALYVDSEEAAELLVCLIRRLANKEGLYFGEHYMSDQICIEKIYVLPEYIPTLHPNIKSLSSIKVFPFGGQDLSLQHSFLDLIVLEDIFDFLSELKDCFFIDSELKEINPIYESFKRIKEIYCCGNYEAFEKLDMLKKASIQEIEDIGLREMNEEDFEQITNQLLNYKIHTLKYNGKNSLKSISNQMFENISKINLQKLHLSELRSISSIFRIFLHLRENINVSFGEVGKWLPLIFEKTLIIFKTKDDIIKAYCDKIGVTFKQDLSQENILFLENYVCISNINKINIENLKRENLTTEIPLEVLSLSDLNNESCILIARNNLSFIMLNLRNISSIFENEINVTNFKSLSLKTKIVIRLKSMEDLSEINKLKEYFPEHSELAIDYFYSTINKTNYDETLLSAILSKFKLTSLEVWNFGRNKDQYEYILMTLLQIPSIQETLEHFDIHGLDILGCTSIFELLVEFKRIKTVEIGLRYTKDDDKLEELKQKIQKIKKEVRKKHSEIEISIGSGKF